MRRALALFLLLFAVACGGGGFVPRSDGGANHPVDFAGTVVDLAGGGSLDSSTELPDFAVAPADFATLPDFTAEPDLVPGACLSPVDCPQNAPICCADVSIGAGTIPNCPILSVQASCNAACATNLPLACPADSVAILCQKGADCTDGNYPFCCLFKNGGTPITACVSAIYKQFVAAQCF